MLAPLLAIQIHPELKNCFLTLLIDNAGAAFNLKRGFAKTRLANLITWEFYDLLIKRNILVRIEYINTLRNMADYPSRGEYLFKYLPTGFYEI